MSPRAGLDGGKSRPTGIRSLDRPAHSSVAISTELPGPHAHKCIKVFCIINIVFLLHVSATLVAVLREVQNKEWIYLDITKVCELIHGCEILCFDFKT